MAEYIEVDRNKLCLFAHKIHFTLGPNTHTRLLSRQQKHQQKQQYPQTHMLSLFKSAQICLNVCSWRRTRWNGQHGAGSWHATQLPPTLAHRDLLKFWEISLTLVSDKKET